MHDTIIGLVDAGDFSTLFIEQLGWSSPAITKPVSVSVEEASYTAVQAAQYGGMGVWVCRSLPKLKHQREVDKAIARLNTERLVIFADQDSQQWRWPRYSGHRSAANPRLVSHSHAVGEIDSALVQKLSLITIPPGESPTVPALLARMREAFDLESERASVAAARLMGALYAELAHLGVSDQTASLLLARVLFLMFGDDTGMWEERLFHKYLESTQEDGSDLAKKLTHAFDVADKPASLRPSNIDPGIVALPHINGGIFHESLHLPALSPEFRVALLEACKFDWGQISPAVFGSMFQEVKSAEERRSLGEHYTTEENILKTIGPLFLDELHERLEDAWDNKAQLTRLHKSLRDYRFLDPACGCGNFLVVAYRELRALELEILKRRRDLDEIDGKITGANRSQLSMDVTVGLNVTIEQFYGIEIEPWPARIAETAMFLVDHQANLRMEQEFGQAPRRLPIEQTAHITIGNALRLDWQEVLPASEKVRVFGNPPFLGISSRSPEQTADLELVWGDRYHGTLDYVTGWHAQSLRYFNTANGQWAFVTTSSITQGEAVAPLFEAVKEAGWEIKFAHRTFQWTSEAAGQAAVHCVIVGFARSAPSPRLFDYATPKSQPTELAGVSKVGPYLAEGPFVIVHSESKPLNPELGKVTYGNKPTDGGWLIVDAQEREEVAADPIAARYLRPYIGAREILHGGDRYCLWLVAASSTEIAESPVLSQRVEGVRQFRAESKAASTREAAATPHLFRQISQPSVPYLCIPRHVSESRGHFLSARFEPGVIASDANFMAIDADGFVFAVISSSMFIAWQRAVGGRLKSDLRFNKFLTWNTFPLPEFDSDLRKQIIAAGAGVQAARDLHPSLSLADLYHPSKMPEELIEVHQKLDLVMDSVFGVETGTSTEARQSALFSAYEKLRL